MRDVMNARFYRRLSLALSLSVFVVCAAQAGATTPPVDPRVETVLHAGLPIDQLHVTNVGGILVVRGIATSPKTVRDVNELAASLGYTRVANLIRVREVPDDSALARIAERRLATTRALDGCQLTVEANRGVLNLAGTVVYDGQKKLAREVLRNIDGVRGVVADLHRQ